MDNLTINRVELRGRIGQEPKITTTNGAQMCRFSLATNEIYHDRSGEIKEDTTWHNVTAWAGRNIQDFSMIQKGAMVSVLGKIRNVKFTGQDGEDHRFIEIVASCIKPFDQVSQSGAAPSGY